MTGRDNIRKLLSFVNPGSCSNGVQSFTINIEVAKSTAIFSRAETAIHEVIELHDLKGSGHEFEGSKSEYRAEKEGRRASRQQEEAI